MTRFQLLIGSLLGLLLTIGAGALHGRITGRWGPSPEAQEAGTLLESLPNQLGPWRLEANAPLGKTEMQQLRPYGYVNRTYVHLGSAQRVSFFVLVGPMGETAVHNPEICYSSRAYTPIDGPKATHPQVEGHRTDELFAMTFRANTVDGGLLRVYYGWSDGTKWEAPNKVRTVFARSPYLYKVQLAASVGADVDLAKQDPCEEFLAVLLPALRNCMVPAKKHSFFRFASSCLPLNR